MSSIFKWYAGDFTAPDSPEWLTHWDSDERGLVHLITGYIDPESRAYVVREKPGIEYLDYDWSLNEQGESP